MRMSRATSRCGSWPRDQRIEFGGTWPTVDRHAALVPLRRLGRLENGGAFENDDLWLCSAEGGRITHLELFEPEDLDEALARFEELCAEPSGRGESA